MQTSVLLLSTKVTSNTLLQMPVKQVSYTTKIMRCPLTIKRQQAAMKINKRIYHKWICWQIQAQTTTLLGFVELCAKILQTMRNDFKDYACTFCQLFLPKTFLGFVLHIAEYRIDLFYVYGIDKIALPPSSKTSDFLYCLARSAALTLAES